MNHTRATLALLGLLLAPLHASATDEVVAAPGADGVQRIELTAGSYYFKPDHVVVKVNAPVELVLRKEPGIVPHDFTLKAPEAGIEVHESLGREPKTVRFTPTATGRFPFYCSKKLLFLESHREHGMEGVLEVTE